MLITKTPVCHLLMRSWQNLWEMNCALLAKLNSDCFRFVNVTIQSTIEMYMYGMLNIGTVFRTFIKLQSS